jgi:hypothetical protein
MHNIKHGTYLNDTQHNSSVLSCVTNKPFILNVIMLNVVMMSVVEPVWRIEIRLQCRCLQKYFHI